MMTAAITISSITTVDPMKVLSRSLVLISRWRSASRAGESTVVHRVASRKTSLSATRSGPNSSTGPRLIAC